MRARTVGRQIDRCTALRTSDLPDARPEPGQLFGRWWANEVLFAKELGKSDELSMPVRATQIREMGRSLQIMGEGENALTSRATKACTERRPDAGCGLTDILKKAQHSFG